MICSDNLGLSSNKTFSLIVYQKPKFTSTLPKRLDVISSNLGNYTLPVIEGIPDEYVLHSSGLPNFVNFNYPTYKFLPDKVSDLGLSTISGKLFNSYSFISFSFVLNVTN